MSAADRLATDAVRHTAQAFAQAQAALTLPAFRAWLQSLGPGEDLGRSLCLDEGPLVAYLQAMTGDAWWVTINSASLAVDGDDGASFRLPTWATQFTARVDLTIMGDVSVAAALDLLAGLPG